jgi:hypothetical protein
LSFQCVDTWANATSYINVERIESNLELELLKNIILKKKIGALKCEELGLELDQRFYQIKLILEPQSEVVSNFFLNH